MRNLSICMLLGAAMATITAASFLFGQAEGGRRFQQFDKNGDGKVTREESGNAPWFDTLDANRDGVITREEAVEAARSRPRPGGGGGSADALAYDPGSTRPMPLSESKAFTELRFTRDLVFGTKDRHGKLMTGTECNYLVAHGGRLYAAVSVWNHDPAAPNPGPAVLAKRSADSPWEVDAYFGARNARVPVLASLKLTTDGDGTKLATPASLLVAGTGGLEHPGEIVVFVRDDATSKWIKSVVSPAPGLRSYEVRHLFTHLDRVTGVDRVFTAVSSGSVFSGVYDPSVPGQIDWDPEPELAGRLARIMSWGEANGDAYLAVDITPDAPKNGGLFRRVDGPQPRWEWIGEWGHRVQHRGVAWVRGLTAIPDPEQPGKELLLCSREVDGVIEVIDPQRNHEARVEFDLRKHFGGLVGAREGQRVTTIFAYNGMTPAVHPDTGQRVHLIGGGVIAAGGYAWSKSAWYLVRHADGRYATGEVRDRLHEPQAVGGLRSVRTICISPFPEDKGRILYFGGFDAGDLGLGLKYRDAGWVYKGTLSEKP
ncbi:MAG: hypothetical protein ACOY3P_17215 [Planctomycetota bacterium]